MSRASYQVRLFLNAKARADRPYGRDFEAVLDRQSALSAHKEIASWPGYAVTPLVALSGFARRVGVDQVYYKDESTRFGLGSFKALGGAYAVYRYLAGQLAAFGITNNASAADLTSGKFREHTSKLTVCCATDGNHGRSVAWGARTFGCRCVVYIHETVSKGRESAIARYGATVVRHPGNYDQTVHRTTQDAATNNWTVISDTSYEGYLDIPRDVMHGYTVMVEEVLSQLSDANRLTHVFVQGGVGGLAAAVCARLWWEFGSRRPYLIVVEPEKAACLLESAIAGKRMALTGDIDTVMAGLSCGETSLLAWSLLEHGANAFVTIPDDAAIEMMRLLADGVGQDRSLLSGESAVAGIAALFALMQQPEMAQKVRLDDRSRILVFGTEGDTDPELYHQIVGRTAAEVLAT